MSELRVYGAEPAGPDGFTAVRRGLRCRCPRCGEGRLFGKFLKVEPECTACGQEFHHHRADDFPPYIVMFIVGHLLGYGIYVAEMKFEGLPMPVHAVLWPTLAIVLCLGLLQPVKGAVVGLQYALGMHGFGQAAASAAHRNRAGDESERRQG
jgi:uncharacterized protein (DUF983 family)